MPVTVRDLPQSTLHSGVILHCPNCDATYSATRGDYWDVSPEHEFVCDMCGDYLELAVPSRSFVPVSVTRK